MSPDAGPLAPLQSWLDKHPRYAYTTLAEERSPAGNDVTARLHVTFDAATNTETVHVLAGKGQGSDIRWSGGTSVDVRAAGILHVITVRMNVRDSRILSPRGNDIRTAIFARVVGCFAADVDHVQTRSSTPRATVIGLSDSRGVRCGEEYGDDGATEDRLTFDPVDGRPLMRERLSGATVVERWSIDDLRP
jgi:hypothetical protein